MVLHSQLDPTSSSAFMFPLLGVFQNTSCYFLHKLSDTKDITKYKQLPFMLLLWFDFADFGFDHYVLCVVINFADVSTITTLIVTAFKY